MDNQGPLNIVLFPFDLWISINIFLIAILLFIYSTLTIKPPTPDSLKEN